MNFINLIRKSTIVDRIKKQIISKDSMSLLLVSPDNDYLEELTKYLCCYLYCKNDACLSCPECKKVISNSHIDIFTYPKKDKMTVDEINELIEESYIKPRTQNKKIIIINRADELSTIIQNKLLKTLEEPSKNVILILTANNKTSLLPTVLSRMFVYDIPHFSMDEVINNIPVKGEDAKVIAAMSDGLIGKAYRLCEDDKYIGLYNDCVDLVFNLKKSSDILKYSETLYSYSEYFDDVLNILSGLYEDILFSMLNKDELIKNRTKIEEINNVKNEYTYSTITEIFDTIEKTRKSSFNNTNKHGLFDEMLFDILEVKFRCHK